MNVYIHADAIAVIVPIIGAFRVSARAITQARNWTSWRANQRGDRGVTVRGAVLTTTTIPHGRHIIR